MTRRDDPRRMAQRLDRKGARRDKTVPLSLALVLGGLLAAAGAAALMVYGVQTLGSASSRTAEAATETPPHLVLQAGHAVRDGDGLSSVHLFVGPDTGTIDLAGLTLRVETTLGTSTFHYGSPSLGVVVQRDADGSATGSAPTLGRGDLVELVLDLDGAGLPVPPDGALTVRLLDGEETVQEMHLSLPRGAGSSSILPLDLL